MKTENKRLIIVTVFLVFLIGSCVKYRSSKVTIVTYKSRHSESKVACRYWTQDMPCHSMCFDAFTDRCDKYSVNDTVPTRLLGIKINNKKSKK